MKIVVLDAANLTPFYNYALSNALTEQGHEVEYISTEFLNDRDLQAPGSVKFNDFYFRFFRGMQGKSGLLRKIIRLAFYIPDQFRLLRYLKSSKPDVVHIQWSRIAILDRILVNLIKNKAGIPVVHTVHDVDPLFSIGSRLNVSRLYGSADKIIVHSDKLKKQFHEIYSEIPEDKVASIPHGPLQAADSKSSMTKHEARSQLSVSEKDFVILFFGEIKHYKGLDILLDAAAVAHERVPNLHVLVAGKPDAETSVPDFKPLTDKGLKVTCKLGFVPNEEVQTWFAAADVVTLPYRKISQSGVIFSAISLEKPVICADTGGLKEVIDSTGAGWVHTPENISELADVIVSAANEASSLEQRGKLAKQKLDQLYSWESIATKTTELYKSLGKR